MAKAAVLAVTLAGSVIVAEACTAILVGRKASASGRVIVAHNEDFRPGSFMRYALLPPRPGAMGAFWSEVKSKTNPQPIAHLFFNTSGVIVFSNNGGVMPKWAGETFSLPDEGEFSTLSEGGIGYRLRCETIEKARTAREGVEIMTDLVKRYGYTERSRLFTIADRDEIWVVEVLYGRRFVARKCPDDAVAVFPNCLTINRIQPGDLVSENIAAKGKDFDFISFYQGPRTWLSPYNLHRWQDAYRIAAGVEVKPGSAYPFAVKPARKVSVEDIQRALSSHYEGMPWEVKAKHPRNNERDIQPICRETTLESVVCAMGETPAASELHLAVGRPCETGYALYHPLAGELPPGAVTGEMALRRLRNHALPPEMTDSPQPPAARVSWRHVGAGMGGNSYWLTVDPNDDRTMFYSPDVGGMYKTADGGETWQPIAVDFSHRARCSTWTLITVAPSDSKRIYACGPQRFQDLLPSNPADRETIAKFGTKESGIARSCDGGKTWESLTQSPLRPGAIAVDPDDADTIWVAGPGYGSTCLLSYRKTFDPHGQGWVAKSTDGGKTWKYVYAGCRDNADACARSVCYSGIVVDRTSPKGQRTVYLSGNGGGVWKSVDGGETWATATNGLASSCVGALAGSYGTDGTLSLYAAACFSPCPERFYPKLRKTNRPGIYRSDDGGATWRDVSGNLNRAIGRYRISVSPKDKNVMYTAQVRGTDMADEQKRMFKTVDGGVTWKACMDFRRPSNLEADRWNNHYHYLGSPDTQIVISEQNPDLLRFADAGCMMWESRDAGGRWHIISSTKVSENRFATRGMDNSFIMSLSVSPKNPDFLLMCCHDFDFLSSVDGGKTFFSGGQTGGIAASGATDGCFGFMSVLHDKDDPKRAYAGSKGWSARTSEGSVFLETTDGGFTWHAPEANPKGMKLGALEDIFSDETMKRVEKRGGGFFLNGTMLLHNWAIRQLVQSRTGRILAVKRTGVYFSDNHGGDWTRASFAGIGKDCDFAPNVLACDAETGRIWASVAYMPIFEGRGLSDTLSPTCTGKTFAPAAPNHTAGLYVSDDNGATFRPAGRRTPEMVLPTVIAVAPGGKAIYLGTSTANISAEGDKKRVEPAGLWKSVDGGETWRRILGCRPTSLEGCVQAVAVNPKRPNVVYAAVREALDTPALCAIMRSTDGGASWEDVSGAAAHGKYLWLSLSAADPADILVGTGGGGAFIGHDHDAE